MKSIMKRRTLLASLLTLAFAAAPALSRAEAPIPADAKINNIAIGCQAYTFNRFTVFEAIDKTAASGAKVIEFYPGQALSPEKKDVKWSHDAPADVVAAVKAKLKEKGLTAVAYGVVGIPKDEAGARKIFEFAKTMGLHVINTESADAIDTIEKMVKEYDVKVGFHDHPKREKDPNYKMWDPNYILSLTKDRDARIGSCADTGHWLRSGLDPVECIKILKGRVVSSHLKDLNEMGGKAHDVPYGTGVSNVKGILDELLSQGFDGPASIEYEHDWDNSLPQVTKCVDFIKSYQPAAKK